MTRQIFCFLLLFTSFTLNTFSQGGFNFENYETFRASVANLSAAGLQQMYARPSESYYKGFSNPTEISDVSYLDSTILKLGLTEGELSLLFQNRFFVSERLSFESFGNAFHNIYYHDLPVFISTDAILHALHKSYDEILKTVEGELMSSNLEIFLDSLFSNFRILIDKYGGNENLSQPLKDAALYITVARSLIKDQLQAGLPVDEKKLNEVWEAVKSEKMTNMSLFADHTRNLDFSQFTVRGHYVYTEEDKLFGLKNLEPYFRTMMWLGRIDFFLTPPPKNPYEPEWTEEDIRRMNIGAFLVNELFQSSRNLVLFRQNEQIIDYLVGESDNILPSEYQKILNAQNIHSAGQLLDETVYANYKAALTGNPEFGQEILSDFFIMDPYADKPGELPISYRLSGQRFILDSYILGSVVYDRIKTLRMMPHPFDALFALGNNDVLPFLESELNKYSYSGQLASLRYLTDNKPDEFWAGSLYNVWLNSIRSLNPKPADNLPVFMQTAAWHQEKINTQLAGWAQLRHDNLLYAKQSYTGGTGCSFPFSFVEPYPEFYKNVKQFAQDAGTFFGQIPQTGYLMNQVVTFFQNFAIVNGKLEILAEKELAGESFSSDEIDWLKSMLFVLSGSGMPPYSGWYSDLYFDKWDASKNDFTIVDIHTQPTDEFGNIVGKVLHAGTGKINLGVFIADCPGTQNHMAFVGPVMSYYQTETENFKRMTDQEWTKLVNGNQLPERPDWTNIYLAGEKGEAKLKGAELPSELYTGNKEYFIQQVNPFEISSYPNPFYNKFKVQLFLNKNSNVGFRLFNSTGTLIVQKKEAVYQSGLNNIDIDGSRLPQGLYLLKADVKGFGSLGLKILKK